MANRERKNELKISLSDDEQHILEQKLKASGMRDKSSFLLFSFAIIIFLSFNHSIR